MDKLKGTLQKETTHISKITGTQFWDNGTCVRRWAETTEVWTFTAAEMKYEHFQDVREYTAVPKTTNKHNDKEDTMSTFTAKSLEEKINPTPVVDHSPARDVRALEKANERAATEIVCIADIAKRKATWLSQGSTTHGVHIPEKYQARLQRILADMRKDQEAILNETAAKLAKVTKAIS